MYEYQIRPYHRLKARQLGVIVRPATKAPYKLDVFSREGEYITSIGDRRYSDFVIYAEDDGYEVADRRRELYHKRHKKDSQIKGSRGYYAANILW
jgi:hypothetical protein